MDKNIEQPTISIILPVYNAEHYVSKSIRSVLDQTLSNFEFLIINDGSNDNSLKKIKEFNDKRIIVINNGHNIGLQKTLNKGLYLARGVYIARIDADDEWIDKYKLEKQINFLEKNKDYCLIGTGAICVNENGTTLFEYLKPKTNKNIKSKLLGYNCFIHSSVMFKKEPVLALGGYSENLETKHVEDYDLWLKLGIEGKLYNLSEYTIKYMIRRSSVGNTNLIYQLKSTIKLANKYKKYYPRNRTINLLRNYARLIYYGYIKIIIKPLK